MKPLLLHSNAETGVTLLSNIFIDEYMPVATGEAVKIYLLLLRHLNDASGSLSIERIAEKLSLTEDETVENLNALERERLVSLSRDTSGCICSIRFEAPPAVRNASSVLPDVPVYVPNNTQKSHDDFQEMIFICEQYLSRSLRQTDLEILSMLYREKGLSSELIEYVVEYCLETGHDSIHYIKQVALNWCDEGIKTPIDARKYIMQRKLIYKKVFSAFGLSGRAPTPLEMKTIDRWEQFGFSDDIIVKAVERTMNLIHNVNFDYTEKILQNWHDLDVTSLEDIAACDRAFEARRKKQKKEKDSATYKKTYTQKPKNSFSAFGQRTDDDDDLQKKLLGLH